MAPVEAAQTLLDDFYNTLERQLAPDGALRPIAGFINKLPEQALRIALCLAFVEDPTVEQLSAEQIQRGIMIAEYYLAQRLRLADPEANNTDLSNAEDLRQWLKQKWKEPVISSADVGQSAPKHLRKAEVAHSALQILAEYGWLTKLNEAQQIKGKLRHECYALHEALTTLGASHE